jgi:Mrp family chromosome partitioning ATPase
MSKNFELLQEIGSDEELFRTSDSEIATSTLSAGVVAAGPDVDKVERERVLRNASLPDVLVPVEESPASQSPHPAENLESTGKVAAELHVEPAVGSLQFDRIAAATTEVPVPPPVVSSQDQRQTDQNVVSREDPQQAHRSILSLFPPNQESLSGTKGIGERIPTSSFGLTWVDVLKAGIRHWIRETARGRYQGGDWTAVAREEETKLVQRVFPATPDASRRTALFSGLEGDVGCASICARTGKILAARGNGPVCLVDANFQSPSLHQCFGAENIQGLSEAAQESFPLSTFLQQVSESDLWLMPCGQAASQLTFSAITDALRERINELRDRFRYVLVHAGPLRLETCAMHISRWTDGVVVVVEANCTRRDSAKRVKETLIAANVNLLGVVLNNRTFPIPEAIYQRL